MIYRHLLAILFLLLTLCCGINKQRIAINNFFIHPNGMDVNNKSINAFIFENNMSNSSFHDFILTKFEIKNSRFKTVTVQTNGFKFVLVFYDSDEFEKYFGSQNFEAKNQETIAEKTGNATKFIAISVVSESGDDCLQSSSLMRNVAIAYLANLKNQYLSKNGRL